MIVKVSTPLLADMGWGWGGVGGKILDLAPTGCLPKVWVQCQKADPILIEQKNLINMAECVATVQDNGTIIRNRSRNASLSVCHSRVLPSVIDLAIATALPIVCREEKNSGKSFFAGLQEGRECCSYKYKDIIFFIHFCVFCVLWISATSSCS